MHISSELLSSYQDRVHIDTLLRILYNDSYAFLGLAAPGYHFFTNDNIEDLEHLLEEGTPDRPAILALFTDVPGNPQLRTADLPRLRALADLYHFPIFLDETVGHHLNIQSTSICRHCCCPPHEDIQWIGQCPWRRVSVLL
jgi:cystathionine beta-lyase/cystathionine gamma-synthase